MKLNIGETIRQLRKERDITQEEFSEVLGVSCQSVSRWENNSCYPEIELLPVIAAYFGISVDKLMGIDEEAEKIAVEGYLKAFQEAVSKGNINECIRISRKGTAEFPNNYILLNKLMYALFIAGSDDADIPNWKENMEKYDDEIVALGNRIIKYCPDTEIRMEATSRLAFQHCEMGRISIGRSIYENMPSMAWCKERSIWWALDEEEKIPHLRKYIDEAYCLLYNAVITLAELLPAAEGDKVFEKLYILKELVHDGNPALGRWSEFNDHLKHAECCMKLNRIDEAIEHLKLSAKGAIDFDNRPDEITAETILLGELHIKRTDYDTADSRTLKEILRDSRLSSEVFDKIRDTAEFKDVIKSLS